MAGSKGRVHGVIVFNKYLSPQDSSIYYFSVLLSWVHCPLSGTPGRCFPTLCSHEFGSRRQKSSVSWPRMESIFAERPINQSRVNMCYWNGYPCLPVVALEEKTRPEELRQGSQLKRGDIYILTLHRLWPIWTHVARVPSRTVGPRRPIKRLKATMVL